jgi:hypothetical protein
MEIVEKKATMKMAAVCSKLERQIVNYILRRGLWLL